MILKKALKVSYKLKNPKKSEIILNLLKICYILPENHLSVKPYISAKSKKLWTFSRRKKAPRRRSNTTRGREYPPCLPVRGGLCLPIREGLPAG